MSAAFLSSASSTIRRASSSGGRPAAGAAAARLGRPSARGEPAISAVRGRAGSGGFGHDQGFLRWFSVQRMVADIGRDRIRDEVAKRPAGRRPPAQLAAGQPEMRRIEERGSVGQVGQVGGQELGAGLRIAVARGDDQARQLDHPARLTPGHEPEERLGRQDEHEVVDDSLRRVGPPGWTRACRRCTTDPRDRPPADRRRTARCRRSPARPSRAGRPLP